MRQHLLNPLARALIGYEGAAEGDPGSFAMTHHLDGIGYKTVAERARLGLTVFDGEAAKVEAASALG